MDHANWQGAVSGAEWRQILGPRRRNTNGATGLRVRPRHVHLQIHQRRRLLSFSHHGSRHRHRLPATHHSRPLPRDLHAARSRCGAAVPDDRNTAGNDHLGNTRADSTEGDGSGSYPWQPLSQSSRFHGDKQPNKKGYRILQMHCQKCTRCGHPGNLSACYITNTRTHNAAKKTETQPVFRTGDELLCCLHCVRPTCPHKLQGSVKESLLNLRKDATYKLVYVSCMCF